MKAAANFTTPYLRHHRFVVNFLADIAPLITQDYNWRDFASAYAHLSEWDKSALGILIEWT